MLGTAHVSGPVSRLTLVKQAVTKHGYENIANMLVDVTHANLSIQHRRSERFPIERVVGHLLIKAAFYGGNSRVRRTPVAHDPTIELQIFAQEVNLYLRIFAGVNVIGLHICAHHSTNMPFLDGCLKGWEVYLPNSSLIDSGVFLEAVVFLIHCHVHVGIGNRALALSSLDLGYGHLTIEVGILAITLEGSPPLGDSDHVDGRAKLHIRTFCQIGRASC